MDQAAFEGRLNDLARDIGNVGKTLLEHHRQQKVIQAKAPISTPTTHTMAHAEV
eukprot:SAG31_NODE_39510_length_287_cov_1.377660_1_plen_53_part_01